LTLQGDRIIIEYQSERALFQADIGNDEIIAERDFWEIDDVVFLESTDGTLPEPFVGGEQYFVVAKTDVEPTIRLKLSSIQGGNPINIINQGTGTHIVKKAPVEWYDAFYVSQVSPLIYLYKYTIQWDGSEEDYVGAGFGSPFNICKIYPVYPVRVYSNNESAEFMYSRSNDINIFGRKKLDEIIVKKTENFRKKIKFIYDDIGLAKNHSYSEPGKGLLQLLRIINVGKDGTILPMLSFEYTSNPDADLFRHDFYGYRSPVDIRTLNPYEYPEGQSQIGDQSNPGSEAWSIKKVIYGTGKIEEYEYEPNEIVALSTNEDIATEANKLFCGIRVKEAKDYSGIGDEMLVTTYEYGKGYAPFSYELEEGVSAFYQTLRGGEFGPPGNEMESINNVIGLRDIYASYSYCKKSIANSGVTKIHFLNPSSNVESYGYSEFTADPGSDELIIGEDIWNVNDGVESRI